MRVCLCLLSLFVITGLFAQERAWRSQLYPKNWKPEHRDSEGRFLHDFSYAGYKNGEVSLPSFVPGEIYNVVEMGADSLGQSDSTLAIQRAIDLATQEGGGVVFLPSGLYRLDGLLKVRSSNVVIRGEGIGKTKIFFTKVAGMSFQNHITFQGHLRQGKDIPLVVDGVNTSKDVFVSNPNDLKVGDDLVVGWVISDEFVEEHQMAGTWKTFNGKWKPFFRRQVVAIDTNVHPCRITLDVPLRYPAKLRDKASVRKESGYLENCGVEFLSVSNTVERKDAWKERQIHVISFQGVKNSWIRKVKSFPSPYVKKDKFHLQSGGIHLVTSKTVTVTDCHMERAQNRGEGGNGYLFEISRCSEILTRDCTAIAGRHNFILNWDFGTSGCVFLRCFSEKSWAFFASYDPIGKPAFCDYHHSLAMACLIDQCHLKDGWYGGNRGHWSSGAGHSVTQSVYWNNQGGVISSWQYGWGYVVGTKNTTVLTGMFLSGTAGKGTEPEDYREGIGKGDSLSPASLYEDQLKKRLK